MDIAVLFGDKSEATANALRSHKDSLDLKPFRTLSSFINQIKQSNNECDRVLINTNALNNKEDIKELYAFLRNFLPSTTVVFLVSARDTSNIQVDFAQVFNLSIYTDVTAQKTTLPFLIECITSSITDLRNKYSAIQDDLSDSSNDNILAESYNEELEVEDFTSAQNLISQEYAEPILSSKEDQPLNPKDKQRIQSIQDTSSGSLSLVPVLLKHKEAMLTQGYFTSNHYPLTMADVDPTVTLFKQRLQEQPRVIHVFKPSLQDLKDNLKPNDLLRLAYADTGVLNLRGFYDPTKISTPLMKPDGVPSNSKTQSSNTKPKKKGLFGFLKGGK